MSNLPQRRLMRSSTDKWIGGVCGGLAEYTGFSAQGIRVLFVVFGFFGAGELAYIILWILMPKG